MLRPVSVSSRHLDGFEEGWSEMGGTEEIVSAGVVGVFRKQFAQRGSSLTIETINGYRSYPGKLSY